MIVHLLCLLTNFLRFCLRVSDFYIIFSFCPSYSLNYSGWIFSYLALLSMFGSVYFLYVGHTKLLTVLLSKPIFNFFIKSFDNSLVAYFFSLFMFKVLRIAYDILIVSLIIFWLSLLYCWGLTAKSVIFYMAVIQAHFSWWFLADK